MSDTLVYDQYQWDRGCKAWRGPNGLVEKSHVKPGWFRFYAENPFSRQTSGVRPSWEEAVMGCEEQNLVPMDPDYGLHQ